MGARVLVNASEGAVMLAGVDVDEGAEVLGGVCVWPAAKPCILAIEPIWTGHLARASALHDETRDASSHCSPENSDTDGDGASSLLRAPGIVSGANRPPSGACHSEPITFVPNRDGAGRGEGSSGDGALPESWGRAAMVDMLR